MSGPAPDPRRALFGALDTVRSIVAVMAGPELVFTYGNRRFQEVTGAADDFLGKPFREALPKTAGRLLHTCREVIESGVAMRLTEVAFDDTEGLGFGLHRGKGYFNIELAPLTVGSEPSGELLAHAVDVTELVMAREEAADARDLYSSLLQDIDVLVWDIDPETWAFTFMSHRAEELLGYPPESWGDPDFFASIVHPDDVDETLAYMEACIERGSGRYEVDFRCYAADGRVVWFHDLIHVETDADGTPTTFKGVMVDITARKEADLERERTQKELVQIQKLESLGILAGGIAHDFNNLLTGILGNASLALSQLPRGAPVRGRLEALLTASERAAALTRKMLAYSGRGHFEVGPIDVADHLEELLPLLTVGLPPGVSIGIALPDDLPAVEADAGQLQQVFMNLVLNAAEASGSAGAPVQVSADVRHSSSVSESGLLPPERLAPGNYVAVTVNDQGVGMDRETLERAFEPFFSTKGTGRGLGLAAVLGIVRGHRGALHVTSAPGEGTEFVVLLPATDRQSRPSEPVTPPPVAAELGLAVVIDDEQAVVDIARHMLTYLGFESICAFSGKAGVELITQRLDEVELVLLDLIMPGMRGEEVLAQLHELDPKLPVILSSGYSESEIHDVFEHGPVGFLQKPYSIDGLAMAITNLGVRGETTD